MRPSQIDSNGAGTIAEKNFKAKESIVLHIGWKCDKWIADNHNKIMKLFTDHVVNCHGDDVERTLGLGMRCINNHACGNDLLHKSPHNCVFRKVYKGNNNIKDDHTPFLFCATSDIKKDTE